jgi:CRP-like cAMP-binding protein
MEITNSPFRRNAILTQLTGSDMAAVMDGGEPVAFKLRQNVYEPEQRIGEVYFPLTSVISVVTHMANGAMIEIGTIGREGVTGVPLLMGSDTTANLSFCQVHGEAWKLPAATFRELLAQSKLFRDLLNRYLQAYVNMLGQLVAFNRLHSVLERCSRWILMTQDRVDENQFPLTHEFLATMLGSRRSGVTIAAAILQKAGFIHYARGHITVLDRLGLEAATCECYQITKAQFDERLRPSTDVHYR